MSLVIKHLATLSVVLTLVGCGGYYDEDTGAFIAADDFSSMSQATDTCPTPGSTGPVPIPSPNIGGTGGSGSGTGSSGSGSGSGGVTTPAPETSNGDEAGTYRLVCNKLFNFEAQMWETRCHRVKVGGGSVPLGGGMGG